MRERSQRLLKFVLLCLSLPLSGSLSVSIPLFFSVFFCSFRSLLRLLCLWSLSVSTAQAPCAASPTKKNVSSFSVFFFFFLLFLLFLLVSFCRAFSTRARGRETSVDEEDGESSLCPRLFAFPDESLVSSSSFLSALSRPQSGGQFRERAEENSSLDPRAPSRSSSYLFLSVPSVFRSRVWGVFLPTPRVASSELA